ncbi:MAG: glucose-6-phosphate dehydrogenase [Gammaproteobacteria bacterium]
MAKFVPVDPFDLVIFGGTGDLAMRKLLPSLYHRHKDAQFSPESRIIAASRGELSQDGFKTLVREALETYLGEGDFEEASWLTFASRLHYHEQDVTSEKGWGNLENYLASNHGRIRVFYLAMSPSLFGVTARNITGAGLADSRSRIVLEKPVGSDLESACDINNQVGAVFEESQIYRIDHYLGKETVQNLSALRFANSLFEPLWQRGAIDHVQISVAEHIGVGNRAEFYSRTGALRDMVQNHMLQLLCLVAMEAPTSMDHDDVRNEKIKVLKALRPITSENVKRVTVRGQYKAGAINGEAVPGYAQELVSQESDESGSDTETFVAIKAEIDNWRWSGTPFYLRTGKRLATKASEIIIQFRPVAHSIFDQSAGEVTANRLTIRLQPNEGVNLTMMAKEPGPGGFKLRSLPLNLSFSEAFPLRYPDAYERLLMEVLRGNPALFMRRDEVESAWKWIDQIIEAWESTSQAPESYLAGSWGPTEAALLLDRDQREWHDPEV